MRSASLILPRPAPCRAPFWANTGHLQTILGHLLPSRPLSSPGDTIQISLPDGDELIGSVREQTGPCVIYLFHGLAGRSTADYMDRTARVCLDQGYTVVAMNHRGCGEGTGRARGIYHSGRGDDLSAVIAWGRERWPNRKHLAIGFSLSGNALLCLASLHRGEITPDAAIAVNAPIDLARAAEMLATGMLNRIYDFRFVRMLERDIRTRFKAGLEDAPMEVPLGYRLRDFDDQYTAPRAGFRDRNDYYAQCSAKPALKRINIPTVLLTALDDPFIDYRDYLDAELSTTTHLHIEATGGHMGYLTRDRTPLGSNRWLDYAMDFYVRQLVNAIEPDSSLASCAPDPAGGRFH